MRDSDESLVAAPSDGTTLLEVLESFKREGYDGDMIITDDAMLRCTRCRQESSPSEVHTGKLRRLEGASDPADMAAVVAVECPHCGNHAAVVVRYGPEASAVDAEVLRSLER
jgi:hypothetical protein